MIKIVFFFLFALSFLATSAQESTSEKLDSTVSIFWNPNLKIRVQIFDPSEPNSERNNAQLTLYAENQNGRTIIFKDSLFAYTIQFKVKDFNGDGINDFLVYKMNNGSENPSYNLYLVDQKRGYLTKVKGFQNVYSPTYDVKKCIIWGFQSFEKRLNLLNYIIDKNGTLMLVTN